MLTELRAYLAEEWTNFFPGSSPAERINLLGVRGSLEGGKFLFLVFAAEKREPVCIAKVLRDETMLGNMQAAFATMRSLGQVPAVAGRIPRALALERIADSWVLVETIVKGTPCFLSLAKDGLPSARQTRQYFNLGFEFLRLLHVNLATAPVRFSVVTESIIEPLFNLKEAGLALEPCEQALIDRARDTLADFGNLSFNPMIAHGDYCRQNVLRHKEYSAVIDWDDSADSYPPLFDAFNFCLTFFHQLTGPIYSIRRSFLEQNRYSIFLRARLQELARQVGLPMDLLPALLVAALVKRAYRESQHLAKWEKEGFLPMGAHAWKMGSEHSGGANGWDRPFRSMLRECAEHPVQVETIGAP